MATAGTRQPRGCPSPQSLECAVIVSGNPPRPSECPEGWSIVTKAGGSTSIPVTPDTLCEVAGVLHSLPWAGQVTTGAQGVLLGRPESGSRLDLIRLDGHVTVGASAADHAARWVRRYELHIHTDGGTRGHIPEHGIHDDDAATIELLVRQLVEQAIWDLHGYDQTPCPCAQDGTSAGFLMWSHYLATRAAGLSSPAPGVSSTSRIVRHSIDGERGRATPTVPGSTAIRRPRSCHREPLTFVVLDGRQNPAARSTTAPTPSGTRPKCRRHLGGRFPRARHRCAPPSAPGSHWRCT